MKKILNVILILVFCQICTASDTQDDIKPNDKELMPDVAFESLDRIEKALYEFRDFTEIVLAEDVLDDIKNKGKAENIVIKAESIKRLENLDWPTQNHGFHNWVVSVRGVLLKNSYDIAKLKLELAKKDKNITEKELQVFKEKMLKTYDKYSRYLENATYSD